MDTVSIVIPTLNRLECLRRAVESARAQIVHEDISIEIVVIDNSLDASAQGVVAGFDKSGWPVRYLSEPKPGVATARNSGVRAAVGNWIAFLDDDEEARPTWIAELVGAARKTGAAAVFGPVDAKADGPGDLRGLGPYFSRTIERPDHSDITDLAAYLGTNNSLFEKAACLSDAEPFETSLNEVGGEDSLLLRRLTLKGLRFAWAAHAGVVEWVPERRLNWAYVRKRKFLSGQIRVFVRQMSEPTRAGEVIKWMAVGIVQVIMAGAAAAILWPFDRNRSARASATMYGGLGKVLWTSKFRPTLYGSGLIS
ncbi:MAG: glycosyltransferase [Hyphomicrobiales bacterium]|nr:glycosyltransferase [Hyphomicrobiales bacterium]